MTAPISRMLGYLEPPEEEIAKIITENEKKYWANYENRRDEQLLPKSQEDWIALQRILHTYFDVPDQPEFWATVASHVCSVPTGKMSVSYEYLANVANRLTVNMEANKFKMIQVRQLEERLNAAAKKTADAFAEEERKKNEGTQNSESSEPGLTPNQEGSPANQESQSANEGSKGTA